MKKQFKDFYAGVDCLTLSDVSRIWGKVLFSKVESIILTKEEFITLFIYFEDKLPYDWDKKFIMGIELIY